MNLQTIETKEILQRADRTDPAIGRIDVLEDSDTGNRYEARYWYFPSGALHHVDSFPVS